MYRHIFKKFTIRGIFFLILITALLPGGSASATNIERISKLQKRAARIILRADYDTPSVDMFSQLGWLSIPDRLKYKVKYIKFTIRGIFFLILITALLPGGSASATNIERISKLQKRAARIILRADYDTPSVDMFSQLGWLSIPDRLKYNKAVLTYRAINNLSPEYITQLLKPVSEVHTLSLRSSENGSLYVPKARTALFDGSFSCSAPRLWNALPQTVKTSGSLSTFKQSLKATF